MARGSTKLLYRMDENRSICYRNKKKEKSKADQNRECRHLEISRNAVQDIQDL